LIEYKIVLVKGFKDDKDALGECDFEAKIIRLKRGQSKASMLSTLMHEIIHAVGYEYDIIDDEVLEAFEEIMIKKYEGPLSNVFFRLFFRL
jgi:hypothetical protein